VIAPSAAGWKVREKVNNSLPSGVA